MVISCNTKTEEWRVGVGVEGVGWGERLDRGGQPFFMVARVPGGHRGRRV